MARPSEYDISICSEICDKIADGKHVVDVLNSDDRYPVWSTFRVWKREHTELQTLYTCSIQDKAEMITHEINQVLTDLRSQLIDSMTARVMIDTLKWYASKFYPKMFGDKIDVTTDGEKLPSLPPIIVSNEAEKAAIESFLAKE